jgi:hypothetical protein
VRSDAPMSTSDIAATTRPIRVTSSSLVRSTVSSASSSAKRGVALQSQIPRSFSNSIPCLVDQAESFLACLRAPCNGRGPAGTAILDPYVALIRGTGCQ